MAVDKLPMRPKRTVQAEFPVGGHGTDDYAENSEPRMDDEKDTGEKEVIVPEGWDSQEEFLAYWVKQYTLDYDADKHNIEQGREDLHFTYVDQWDPETRNEREAAGRPCLTVNTLPQFIGQVVGDRRINRTSIKVSPTTAANKKEAEVRSGLIKSIEQYSRAERVYDMCCEDQVAGGVSNFEITLEYSQNDVFHQDIFVRPFNNPFAVIWDRMSKDPTGRDARHCFVEDMIPKDVFEEEYPDEPIPTGFPSSVENAMWSDWCNEDDGVKVAALWIMEEKDAKFALMQNGTVEDVTGLEEAAYLDRVVMDKDGPMVRDGTRTYAQRWLITGFTILEGPYELPLSRLPVIKVSGRVGRVGSKQYRFGLVRWARDAALMRNYWRSVAVETLAMAPKSQWIADAHTIKGREDDFREAHLSNDPLLVYNTGRGKPERVDPPSLPSAVLNEAAMNTQDIKDTTGLQDASLGVRSNEVSGKAIMARQREGDVATITYHDHLNHAIQEGGVVMNELIPLAYDTIRTVRVIGADDQPEFMQINDPVDDTSPNIVSGKYDVTISTGPSFTTQRMEASESMLEAVKVFPQLMEVAGDIMVEVQDWPGAERISQRLKKVLPAAQQEEQERQAEEAAASGQPPEPSPEEAAQLQAQEMQQQLAEQQMQFEIAKAQLELQKMEADLAKAQSDARYAEARAAEAEENARAARAKADAAEAGAQQADDEVEISRVRAEQDVVHREEQHRQGVTQKDEQHRAGQQERKTRRNNRKEKANA